MKFSCIFTIIQLNHSIVHDTEQFISVIIEGNSFIQCTPRLMALPQLMHLGTWCKVTHCLYQWTKECKLSKGNNISGHKWSTTHRVLKSHKSKISIITYMFHDNIYIMLILLLWDLSTVRYIRVIAGQFSHQLAIFLPI